MFCASSLWGLSAREPLFVSVGFATGEQMLIAADNFFRYFGGRKIANREAAGTWGEWKACK